jgi:MFS transporter, SET family, sugar efflux transporter
MSATSPIRLILNDPAQRLAAVLLVLLGAQSATLAPYGSAIAATVFGFGHGAFSLVLICASVVAVSGAILFGILADQRANRRAIALVTLAVASLGTGLMTVVPAPVTFVIAHAFLLPLSSSFFGQLFAFSRLAASGLPRAERASVLAANRALYALPWIVVLPLWALVFRGDVPLSTIYPVCLALSLGLLAMTWVSWPRDGTTTWPDQRSGLSFTGALRELAEWRVLVRVLALGGVNGAITLYLVLVGLVFISAPGRGASDTALYAGLMAGLEVPFMLLLPAVLVRLNQTKMIAIGAALYGIHLVGLPLFAASPLVWGFALVGAAGGAVLLTQPMAYLQDLMSERPGAGSSLMAIQRLVGDGLAALAFSLGTALSGYILAALIGAAMCLSGAVALMVLDRQSGAFQPSP